MSDALNQFTEQERVFLVEYVKRCQAKHGARIVEIWFFGSRARGDYAPNSDYDLLIVLDDGDSQVRDDVRLLAARVSLEHDVLINTHILSRTRWERLAREQAPYWRNVQTEGVSLWEKDQVLTGS